MNINSIGTNGVLSSSLIRRQVNNQTFELGQAPRETTSSNSGRTIGLCAVGNQAYLATYADSSTPTNPVIKVGDYEVEINKVDLENATQLEMFAWTSYAEDAGIIEKHGMSSYSKMKTAGVQSQYDGLCTGIYDGKANVQNFWDKKQNWVAILENAKKTFSNMPETYRQSLECGKILSYIEKWMDEKIATGIDKSQVFA